MSYDSKRLPTLRKLLRMWRHFPQSPSVPSQLCVRTIILTFLAAICMIHLQVLFVLQPDVCMSDTGRERKCIRRREGWLERHLIYLAEEG